MVHLERNLNIVLVSFARKERWWKNRRHVKGKQEVCFCPSGTRETRALTIVVDLVGWVYPRHAENNLYNQGCERENVETKQKNIRCSTYLPTYNFRCYFDFQITQITTCDLFVGESEELNNSNWNSDLHIYVYAVLKGYYPEKRQANNANRGLRKQKADARLASTYQYNKPNLSPFFFSHCVA